MSAPVERTREALADEVRVAKLKLGGLRDPVIADLLPGARRVCDEVSALLDKLLAQEVTLAASAEPSPEPSAEAIQAAIHSYLTDKTEGWASPGERIRRAVVAAYRVDAIRSGRPPTEET